MKETDLRFFSCKMSFDGNKNRVDINILQTFGEIYLYVGKKRQDQKGKQMQPVKIWKMRVFLFSCILADALIEWRKRKEGISKNMSAVSSEQRKSPIFFFLSKTGSQADKQ